MSEEKKKAIETIHNFINYFNKNKEDGNKANLIVLGEEIEALDTLLNLIKNSVSKDEIRKKIIERQFELQQAGLDFKDDIRLNTLQDIYYMKEE